MGTIDIKNRVNSLVLYKNEVKELLTENYSLFDSLLPFYTILIDIDPTYISPAYHLNNYIKLLDDPYAFGLFGNEQKKIKHTYLRIEFQDTLIAIRNLLDRIVKLIGIHYSEVAKYTSFGYFDDKTKKSKGFMKFVDEQKEYNEFFEYIYNEYNLWIKRAIGSRNKVIHYNDLPIVYRSKVNFENPLSEIPTLVHLNKTLHEGINIENTEEVDEIAFDKDNLIEYVTKSFNFFNITVEHLIEIYK